MMGNGMGGMGWYWLFGALLILGLALIIVIAVSQLSNGLNRRRGAVAVTDEPSGRSQAREILDERYARGELSTEQYRERLQGLGEDN